MLPHLVTHLGK